MALLVLKFGGTSVADIERIKNVAGKIAAEAKLGHKVAVVVSAMAGATDHLIGLCRSLTSNPNAREQDVVVATGEQVSAGLLAMALQQRGLSARSMQGWQVPIHTNSQHTKALIADINVDTLYKHMDRGEVVVLAGFQGITEEGDITTLGRGGGDLTAVALAAALKADRCDIYTDVDGVYTSDPRIVSKAQLMKLVSYQEMLELASLGAKVLQTRSVEMAFRYHMPLQVLSTFGNAIGSELPGTLVTDEDSAMEQKHITGVALSPNEAKLTLCGIANKPGTAARIFGTLAHGGINVDMIIQTSGGDGQPTDLTFTVARSDIDRAKQLLETERQSIGYTEILAASNVVKVSLVGSGMRAHPGIAAQMFETLGSKNINIQAIETSEISISVLISEEYAELALRSLHSVFQLDGK